jgi:hypothetical protein
MQTLLPQNCGLKKREYYGDKFDDDEQEEKTDGIVLPSPLVLVWK